MKKRVTFDFETRSEVELKKAGAFKYSLDKSTRPTCLAFKIFGEPTVYFLDFYEVMKPFKKQNPKLQKLWTKLIDDGYLFTAHNAFFERCIYTNIMVKRFGWPKIPPRLMRCTAAKAAAAALPRSLEKAGEALQLRIQKDKRGYNAMMATCKPQTSWNNWRKMREAVDERLSVKKKLTPKQQKWVESETPEPPKFRNPKTDPEVFNVLYHYCKVDVLAEEQLDKCLPDLIPQEQEIWFHNQMLNWRGLPIDISTSEKIVKIMEVESKKQKDELDDLTAGLVTKPGSIKSILEFLDMEGVSLPNLKKQTVEDQLESFMLDSRPRRLLELRKLLSLTSTKKYQSFILRACKDGRVRDITLYCGAHTGRDTGTGIQPHNFPRGLMKIDWRDPYQTVNLVIENDHEWLKFLYGETLPLVFSAILRNMLIPEKHHEMFVADFSKIEVAVLWWLAGNEKGLDILRSGKDPYVYQAAENTGKTYKEIEKAVSRGEKWAEDARQLGKAQILGCGFGMGWSKFQKTAEDFYRLKLTDKQSKEAVVSYREANETVPAVWKAFERAAIEAVKTGKPAKAGKCKFIYDSKKFYGRARILWAELPSGRRLSYVNPQIAWRVRQYEQRVTKMVKGKEVTTIVIKTTNPMETLEYWGVNSKTKKWDLMRIWGGTWAENLTQATARDLMMPAMVRLEKIGFKGLLAVHDEALCQVPIDDDHSVQIFVKELCRSPKWAVGLPIDAKGWKGPRYMKR